VIRHANCAFGHPKKTLDSGSDIVEN
jgi:hypothetical protein